MQKHLGDFARQTGGQAHQAAGILPQQLHVDPRLDVKALREGGADHPAQVFIARLIFAQQNQVVAGRVHPMFPAEPGIGRHINLTADDRLDALFLRLFIKIHHAVHDAVVCDRH